MAVTSSRKRRSIKAPEDRRRELMDAAVRVFTRKGITEASISDVTEAAGVAKGTFYLYFDSKEHLLASLRERFVDELMVHSQPFLERMGKDDWWSLADDVAESMVDFTLEHADECAFIAQQPHTPGTKDILGECEQRITDMLAVGIRAGMEAGAFRVSDPELAAVFLKHGTIWTVLEAIMYGHQRPDRDRLVQAAKELSRKALAP
jgi:AcrR family transcriptional regulator